MLSPVYPEEKNSSSTVEKITEIQQEISRIRLHQTEHVVLAGRNKEIRKLERSCRYCSIYFDSKESPARQQQKPAAPPPESKLLEKKPAAASKDLERTVDVAGKKGQVVVPRSWAGKRVRVILL